MKETQHTILIGRFLKNNAIAIFVSLFFFLSFVFLPVSVSAQQSINIDASTLLQRANLFLSPRTATIIDGATIEIPVFVNTEKRSINTVSLYVNFDPTKMILVNPSNNNSIIGIWVDPPTYSNTKGTLALSGVIPNGITTDSGLITTMTFRAVATGQAVISISDASRVLANDGQGTAAQLQLDRGTYSILPKSPEGPQVFSDTHPFQDIWYNNNSPVLAWNKDDGVTGFSFTIDDKPFTIPDNQVDATDTVISYPNLSDGIWYFHIKAQKQGMWGGTTHFVIRVDTAPPADFTPQIQMVSSSGNNQALVSFFTTDMLSGLDHYEVGVIDVSQSSNNSPVFVQADSPYQLTLKPFETARVTVRAFDKAGNVKDETINVISSTTWLMFLKQNWLIILLLLLLIGDYLFGHKMIARAKRILRATKEEESEYKSAQQQAQTAKTAEPKKEMSLEEKQKQVKDQYLKNLEALNANPIAVPAQNKESKPLVTGFDANSEKLLPAGKNDIINNQEIK